MDMADCMFLSVVHILDQLQAGVCKMGSCYDCFHSERNCRRCYCITNNSIPVDCNHIPFWKPVSTAFSEDKSYQWSHLSYLSYMLATKPKDYVK
jgi:hypothetical protein